MDARQKYGKALQPYTGFCFFTRDQLPNNNLVEIIKEKAIKKGFTLEKMNPIIQEGCLYRQISNS